MDIMNMFRSVTPAAAPAQIPGAPTGVNNPGVALPGTQASPLTAPNGLVPDTAGITPPTPAPLDTFKDIWQTDVNAQADSDGRMFQSVDPQKLMESAGKVDFSKVATAEQMAAVASGGEAGVKAMMEMMNKVAQSVYAQSAFATTKIVDQALANAQTNYDKRLPNLVKKFSVNENLQATNPLLSNPALTPLVSALSEQLVRKNPQATSAEIQSQVNDYFQALGTTFAPKAVALSGGGKKAKEEDWSIFG